MGDIFDLIRASEEYERKDRNKTRRNMDELFIETQQRTAVPAEDLLKEEIGNKTQTTKKLIQQVETLDFVALDKMKAKDQVDLLKDGYLDLLAAYKDVAGKVQNTEDEFQKARFQAHELRKELVRMREGIRKMVALFPEGYDLKRSMEGAGWKMDDIEGSILKEISSMSSVAEEAMRHIQKIKEEAEDESTALKRKILSLQQELEQRTLNPSPHMAPPPPTPPAPEVPLVPPVQPAEIHQAPVLQPAPVPEHVPVSVEPTPAKKVSAKDVAYKFAVIDLERYATSLTDQQKEVILVIGKTGVARNQELREVIEQDAKTMAYFMKKGSFYYPDMQQSVKVLKETGFLNGKKISLGTKGAYNPNIYEFSDLGRDLYRFLSGELPVPSQTEKLKAKHGSEEHGYLIKDVGQLFAELGYTVYTESEDCRYDVPGESKFKMFDLVIEMDGEKKLIEVERGTHNQEDFFDACNKIYKITNKFYFVTPNEQILFGKTKTMFYHWINKEMGGIENVKGKLEAYFTTYEWLKKKKKTLWDVVKW